MMQELKVNDQVTVKFDQDVVLVPKERIDELLDQVLLGRMWKIKDVAKRLGVSEEWVRTEILRNPRFSKDLNQLRLNGVVVKGEGQTSPWRFKASEFAPWLDQNIKRFKWE